jgi:uncharacterized protein YvpB
MPTILLPVPHYKQIQEADCLPACVAMVLAFINYPINYRQILNSLETSAYGTVASHVLNLTQWKLQVTYAEGELSTIRQFIEQGHPVIVLVQTGELSYWGHDTMHAIVVVGYDKQHFYVNDPHFDTFPLIVSSGDFDLAWFEMGNRYIVITQRLS